MGSSNVQRESAALRAKPNSAEDAQAAAAAREDRGQQQHKKENTKHLNIGHQIITMASQTPPSKESQSRLDESPMVALIYTESIPQASYKQWLAEKTKRLSPIKPAASSSLADMDSPTKKRHDIGYICENLESWVTQLNQPTESGSGGGTVLPSLDQVRAVVGAGDTGSIAMNYNRDGLIWRSDVRTCVLRDNKNVLWKNVVIHLPNDGFFYVEESLLPVLATNRRNERHMNTCSEGWAYLDHQLWPKLAPFENFARNWFNYDPSKKLQRQIMYNDTSNRLDISLRCPELHVGIDFVFEPGYPVPDVPEDFWF
jgi:hypothetical protein